MTSTVKSATRFAGVAVPRLPQFADTYDAKTQEMYSNVLRLYFNQLNGVVNQLSASSLSASQANTNNTNPQAPYVFTVATLPSPTTINAGVRAFVSDATATTFNSIVAGGGANKLPIFCDGTNWRIG
jgi:hypothetical protein